MNLERIIAQSFERVKTLKSYRCIMDLLAGCKRSRASLFSAYGVVACLKGQPFDQARVLLREDGPILLLERFQDNRIQTRNEWHSIELNIEVRDEDFDL